jgi:hypothetical protein
MSRWTSWALVDRGSSRAGSRRAHPGYLDLSSGRVKDISPLDKATSLWFRIRNGKFVIYQQNDMLVSNVMLLENFR